MDRHYEAPPKDPKVKFEPTAYNTKYKQPSNLINYIQTLFAQTGLHPRTNGNKTRNKYNINTHMNLHENPGKSDIRGDVTDTPSHPSPPETY